MPKSPQCRTCPLGTYQSGLPQTHDEPGEPGGWYCEVKNKFVPDYEAPLVGYCNYFTGHQHGHEHPLDIALRQGEAGEKKAVAWLVERVPGYLLYEAWADAPTTYQDRFAALHIAETRSEHSARNGATEN